MSMELREEARRREREREAAIREREEFARDLRALALRPEGRRLFRWVLRQGDVFREDCPSEPSGVFAAGRRSLALRLWRHLEENLDRRTFVDVVWPAPAGDGDGSGPGSGVAGPPVPGS